MLATYMVNDAVIAPLILRLLPVLYTPNLIYKHITIPHQFFHTIHESASLLLSICYKYDAITFAILAKTNPIY